MKRTLKVAAAGALVLASGAALAQGGHMMNDGFWGGGWMGGYGGPWVPILLVAVVGLVAWIVVQKRK